MVLSKFVGASVRRKEDPRLITGSSTYVDDLELAGLLHVAIVRSRDAHATIKSIDASDALATPGVVAVYTGADLARILKGLPTARGEGGESETGQHANEPEVDEINTPVNHPLSPDKVRWIGEGIAAVVATSRYIAEDAAELVVVDADPLPAVVDPYEAMQDGAPQLYDDVKNNISVRESAVHGDIDAAFKDAAVVAKARIRSPRVAPAAMEGRAVLAAPDPITRGLTVWTSTQAPHWNRNDIAAALGLSQNQVRCIAPEVGGGFGGKIGAYPEDLIVSALAWDLKRPVKWIETRSENFLATNHGRNQWADFEVAADADGKLLGAPRPGDPRFRRLPQGARPRLGTWVMSTGCYEIPTLDYDVIGVYTNTMANGAYRGAGRPEAAFYLERVMDLARRRRRPRPGRGAPHELHPAGQVPVQHAIRRAVRHRRVREAAEQGAGSRGLRRAARGAGARRASRAATSASAWRPTSRSAASGRTRAPRSGSSRAATVTIFTGISPHGQGQETTFAQIAADDIGADFDEVVVHHGDTANTPQGNGTMGSRGLAVGGAALMLSLDKIKEKASRIAAHMLEAVRRRHRAQRRQVPGQGRARSRVSLWPRSPTWPTAASLPAEIDAGLESTDFFRPDAKTFPFGTHVAVVEVFPETGEVEAPALRLGRRLRQDHQPDAGDRAGPRRPRPGHRPGALGRAAPTTTAASCSPARSTTTPCRRPSSSRCSRRTTPRPPPRSTRSAPRASARRPRSARPRPPPTR